MLFRAVYPKPEIIGSVQPVFFEEVRSRLPAQEDTSRISASFEFVPNNGVLELWSATHGGDLADSAACLVNTILALRKNSKRLGTVAVNFRTGESYAMESWHYDNLDKDALAVVTADNEHTTLFAHGVRVGIDHTRLKVEKQGRKAQKIAESLARFRPKPFELALFNSKVLHSPPVGDLDGRLWARVVLT